MFCRGVGIRGLQAVARTGGRRSFSSSSGMGSSQLGKGAMVAAAGVATMFLFGRGGAEPVEMQAVQVDVQPVVLEEPVVVNENVLVLDVANVDLIKNLESRVKQLEKDFAVLNAGRYNEAFVFVKPHAVTEKVKEIVKEGLEKAGITIKQEGNIAHDKIDQLKLIDNHYGAIANKAVLQKPSELNVPEKGQGQFEKMFGESWSDAIAKGEVYNAKDAAEKLGISGKELGKLGCTKKVLIKCNMYNFVRREVESLATGKGFDQIWGWLLLRKS
mmetsp:Transcript_25774/g.41670  ORF Transcript_25774/g.41670 Transcript_25774/m.41670 type:complete len:272 (+) Transcript_25774:73-888(+)